MARIPLGIGAYSRPYGKMPPIQCVNRFFEQNPASAENVALLSRPATREFLSEGSGPVRALHSKYGVFNGDLFFVSGTQLFRYSGGLVTPIDGELSDIDIPVMDSVAIPGWEALFITDGLSLQYYDGLQNGVHELKSCSVPDGVPISDIAVLASFVICAQKRSQKFFWIRPGETDIEATDFSSMEAEPDEIVNLLTVGDQLWIFGQSSTEAWYASGDDEQPFVRAQGRAFSQGILPGTLARVQDHIFLVAQDRVAYRIAGSPERISHHGIEEILRKFEETVDVGVSIDFTITGQREVQFAGSAATPSPVVSYEWDFGDGSTDSSGANPVHTYAALGTYDVTLRVTAENGTVGVAKRRVSVTTLLIAPTSIAGLWARTAAGAEQIVLIWTDPNDYVEALPRKVFRNGIEIADLGGVSTYIHTDTHPTEPLVGETENVYTIQYYDGADTSPVGTVVVWAGPETPAGFSAVADDNIAYVFNVSWTGGEPEDSIVELETDYLCPTVFVSEGEYAHTVEARAVGVGISSLVTADNPEIQQFQVRIRAKLTTFGVDDYSDYVTLSVFVIGESGETDGFQTCP